MICETFSCSRKDYVTLPDNYDIELCFIKEQGDMHLKVSFFNENDDEIFCCSIPVSPEFEEVAESIMEKITADFQTTLTSSVGNVVVFDLDKYLDPWLGHLNEQLADYCKKHFK